MTKSGCGCKMTHKETDIEGGIWMRQIKYKICIVVFLLSLFLSGKTMVSAAEYGDTVQWHERTVAIYNEEGEMMYQPIGDDGELETQALNYLLGNDQEKTLMIPEGTVIKLNRELTIGSNTTLIATGVTMMQTKDGTGGLMNRATDVDYRSLENVVIQGGVWKNKHKKRACPMICFVQASNVQMEDMTIITNIQENGVRLIACRNVTLSRCEIRDSNVKNKKTSPVMAAVEIDPATSLLTSGLKSVINEQCINGQTCQNIKLEKCIVHGGRGIYVAYSRQKKYRNKLHSKVILSGCTVTGTRAEAVLLENTVGFTIKNNLLITQAGKNKKIHAAGMLAQLYATKGKTHQLASSVSGNVVYGIRYGMVIRSKTKCKYGRMKIVNNRNHVQTSKKKALLVKNCKNRKLKNNRAYVSS